MGNSSRRSVLKALLAFPFLGYTRSRNIFSPPAQIKNQDYEER